MNAAEFPFMPAELIGGPLDGLRLDAAVGAEELKHATPTGSVARYTLMLKRRKQSPSLALFAFSGIVFQQNIKVN